MLNKHNYKIVGLKKAVSEMPGENNKGLYLQIDYNYITGKVLTNFHCSLGQNSWTEYHDNDIIRIGNYTNATMQQIADDIADRMIDDEY